MREVVYDRHRQRQINEHLRSIRVQMDLDGEGPEWVIPSTGELTIGALDSAERCDKIASLLRMTRDRLAGVDFDQGDRAHLREGFEQLARAWKRRGAVWRTPAAPDPDGAAAAIAGFERAALREFKSVHEYFRGGEDSP